MTAGRDAKEKIEKIPKIESIHKINNIPAISRNGLGKIPISAITTRNVNTFHNEIAIPFNVKRVIFGTIPPGI